MAETVTRAKIRRLRPENLEPGVLTMSNIKTPSSRMDPGFDLCYCTADVIGRPQVLHHLTSSLVPHTFLPRTLV